MDQKDAEGEIRRLVTEWNRCVLEKDVATAERLRAGDYQATTPDGAILSRSKEIAMIASPAVTIRAITLQRLDVQFEGEVARATAENLVEGQFEGQLIDQSYSCELRLRKSGGRWQAISSAVRMSGTTSAPRFNDWSASPQGVTGRVRSWLKRRARATVPNGIIPFQALAFRPSRPGADYILPPAARADTAFDGSNLPIPPPELWLGYNYPAHGKRHVDTMLEIVARSGFTLGDNGRILDLGCGAGRMIRHLAPLTERCEIWGADISAEHIFWCKQHLSPPFHFATITKVPHLPFEDRSFSFIYCGSLFTHIDDLADAWLLELRRILAPGGRLYITVHDNHTIELFEQPNLASVPIVAQMRASPTYRKARDSFGMFTVGRDDEAQVFYHEDYLQKMLGGMFDILSITREAYFYQTAYLLTRNG